MEKHYEEPSWSSCLSEPLLLEVIKEGVVINSIKLIGKPYFWVGRTPDCDVQLDHPSVSRLHAVIQSDGAQLYLYDLESTHGTYLNKQKLEPRKYFPVHVGEPFHFGLSTRQFVVSYGLRVEEEEEHSIQETSACSVSSREQNWSERDTQKNHLPENNDVKKNQRGSVDEEEEDELFETEDEERQRLEALGGFEDVLGANFGDDSDDEFYDRTGSSYRNKPTVISYHQKESSLTKHVMNNTTEEEDELEEFMKQNQQALDSQRENVEILATNDNHIHSDKTNMLDNTANTRKKDENEANEQEEEEEEEKRNARKRARIPYGPTRASLPVYDRKLISAQMSDPDGEWQPPSGQSGDGKTWLNDVLHY